MIFRKSTSQRRRAYTLVELSIVALLATVLIAVAARWVGQLGQVALRQASVGVQSAVVVANDRMDDDVTAASHCSPWGLDNPVVEITPSSLTLFSDTDGDNVVSLVRWSVDTTTGVLTRSEAPVGSDCALPVLPDGVVQMTGVTTGTSEAPLFSPSYDGVVSEDMTDWGACADRSTQRCRIGGVQVDLTVAEAGVPIVVRHHYQLQV